MYNLKLFINFWHKNIGVLTMRRKPIRYKLSVFLTLVIGILMFQSVLYPSRFLIKENYIQCEKEGLKASEFWVLPYTIHIDSNWSDTESTYDWCTGSGTWDDPYLIENVTVDAHNSGSSIFLENSDDYFIIHNCTVINSQESGYSGYPAGIKLNHVSNGTIFQNVIKENFIGMYFDSVQNVTINDNTIIDNPVGGIILYHSNENYILENFQTLSNYTGLFLNSGSNNNIIRGNTFQNNTGDPLFGDGIRIRSSQDNYVIDNILINNDKGILIEDDSHNNTIMQNIIESNSNFGALIVAQYDNTIDNLFYLNTFDNHACNAYDNGTDSRWDNGTIGNYWSDYDGVDANDDGIGDTQYSISGMGGGIDNFPIWDDGDSISPVITILSPLDDSHYNTTAPAYLISIIEVNLDTYYYVISGNPGDYVRIINSLSGTIDQSLWDSLPAGTYTLTMYANDTAGNLSSASITIVKDSLPSGPPTIPFGSFYLILAVISVAIIISSIRFKLKLKRQL